jgi:predicted outer membrane protein
MLVVALAALPTAARAQAHEGSDDNDLAVHAFLSAVDLGELKSSMLATQRATSPEVRSFAQEMLGDHGNALHTREMLMQTENSGLVQRMVHTENTLVGTMPNSNPAAGGQTAPSIDRALAEARPGTPAQAPTESHVLVEETATGKPHADHDGGAGIDMRGPPGVTLEMVQEMEARLATHPMSRPVMEANEHNLQVLQGVTGPQFDKSYMDAQIGAHRYALSNVDRMLAQGGALGDDIRGALRQTRTAVAAHLQMAEQIRARLP